MTKISKEHTLEQGKEEYAMLTCDFGSLQMRLTTQDTCLDSKDGKTPDKGLYDIYREDSECSDAHSSTGKATFCTSIGGQTYDIELENGDKIQLYQDMYVYVNANGVEQRVKVLDLKGDEDIIIITDDKGKQAPKVDYNF